jgi:hypothetical protein
MTSVHAKASSQSVTREATPTPMINVTLNPSEQSRDTSSSYRKLSGQHQHAAVLAPSTQSPQSSEARSTAWVAEHHQAMQRSGTDFNCNPSNFAQVLFPERIPVTQPSSDGFTCARAVYLAHCHYLLAGASDVVAFDFQTRSPDDQTHAARKRAMHTVDTPTLNDDTKEPSLGRVGSTPETTSTSNRTVATGITSSLHTKSDSVGLEKSLRYGAGYTARTIHSC